MLNEGEFDRHAVFAIAGDSLPDAGNFRYIVFFESDAIETQVQERMIVVNTETVAGYRVVEVKGIVQGNTVRAKHAGRDIAAGFKTLSVVSLKATPSCLPNRVAKQSNG